MQKISPFHQADEFGARKIAIMLAKGTLFLASTLETLLILYSVSTNSLHIDRLIVGFAAISYAALSLSLCKRVNFRSGSLMVPFLYYALSIWVLATWGINSAVGLLLLSFVIFITGITQGLRSILPATFISVSSLILVHLMHASGMIVAQREALALPSHTGDVVTYGSFFTIFGLVSWVAAHHIAVAFRRAQRAEYKLVLQKGELERRLADESHKLRQAQLEEIQQLYHFADVGQSTTAILHELANHLSVLNLDIDDIAEKHQHTEAIARAQESIRYINKVIRMSREKMRSQSQFVIFNSYTLLKETVDTAKLSRNSCNITYNLRTHHRRKYPIFGDPASLSHIVTILLNNSRDACSQSQSQIQNESPTVNIALFRNEKETVITISDNGPGIPNDVKQQLFHPKKSTKSQGLGIGLYIAHHIVKTHFSGTLTLLDTERGTSFAIAIPHHNQRSVNHEA